MASDTVMGSTLSDLLTITEGFHCGYAQIFPQASNSIMLSSPFNDAMLSIIPTQLVYCDAETLNQIIW